VSSNPTKLIKDGTVTKFIYDVWNCVAEYDDEDTLQASYITPGLDQNLSIKRSGNTYYYHQDGLSSIRNITDSSEVAQNTYDYYAFGLVLGTPTENVTNGYRFTARRWDAESSLYYYRARMYAPTYGRFTARDPILEGNLYIYVINNPLSLVDPYGLTAEEPGAEGTCGEDDEEYICGPDMAGFLKSLINSAINWENSQGGFTRRQGINWLKNWGSRLDWLSTLGSYKTSNCPKGDKCRNTYWLCGECVHDHWIGNFMYGFLGKLFSIPDFIMDWQAKDVQGPGPGDDADKKYHDPPWDKAGYDLARLLYKKKKGGLLGNSQKMCEILKSNMGLWNQANNTTKTSEDYPTPHASGYQDCKECPEGLDPKVSNTFPGGRIGSSWPSP